MSVNRRALLENKHKAIWNRIRYGIGSRVRLASMHYCEGRSERRFHSGIIDNPKAGCIKDADSSCRHQCLQLSSACLLWDSGFPDLLPLYPRNIRSDQPIIPSPNSAMRFTGVRDERPLRAFRLSKQVQRTLEVQCTFLALIGSVLVQPIEGDSRNCPL